MVTSVKNPSGVHANIDEKPFHERDRRVICSSKPVLKLPGGNRTSGDTVFDAIRQYRTRNRARTAWCTMTKFVQVPL